MRFIKYEPSDGVVEYLAYDENQAASKDILSISYPDCIRVMICANANSPTLERASFIPFGDEIEITEKEFFEAYVQAHSTIVDVIKDTTTYKVLTAINHSTKLIRQKIVELFIEKFITGKPSK